LTRAVEPIKFWSGKILSDVQMKIRYLCLLTSNQAMCRFRLAWPGFEPLFLIEVLMLLLGSGHHFFSFSVYLVTGLAGKHFNADSLDAPLAYVYLFGRIPAADRRLL